MLDIEIQGTERKKKTSSCSTAPNAAPTQHGRGPGPGGQASGPGQSEPALRSGPWPRPSAPRAFSNLREPLHTREPARVGSDRMGGANGSLGWPRPSQAGSARPSPPPPTPAKNTSRLRSPGVAAAGSVAPPPPPSSSPQSCPRPPPRSPGSLGGRRPSRARAPAALFSIRQWGPLKSRAHRAVEAGDGPRPYCLHARTRG